MRVLDLGGAESDGVGRLFADLGADVLKVEPPGGSPARAARPAVSGAAVAFALNNANKRSTVLDATDPADRDRFIDLVAGADVVVDSGIPGGAAAFGTSLAALADGFEHVVALSVTDFGTTGPHSTWRATDAVLYAMSTALSRSGPTTGTPILPPDGIASATAAAQAAWAALAAYYHRLRCGRGEFVDFSRYEAVLQSLDPPFGSEGQAVAGQKKSTELWRGRPRNQQIYPTFACLDGYVRLCLLSPRQWRGMRAWLGEPEQFSDPKFESIAARYAASREINVLIADLFATQSADAIVAEGQRRGVPVAGVLTPAEALASGHFRSVGALTEIDLGADSRLTVPTGPFVVDGRRAGLAHPAPAAGGDEPVWRTRESDRVVTRVPAASRRPFDGLRIVDLGVIVAGGELGRLFADLGADVIKVESPSYPDGLRQAPPGVPMSRSFALTHRNESSLGLDLRQPEGADLFRRLVADADAVFANFKPGTLASLGFSHDELRRLNQKIVLAESSAFGSTGPWSDRMGYGPLVRAATGVSRSWTSDDPDDGGFYDATTIFPDHVASRLTAIAALAALIGSEATGAGAHAHISQAETAINQLAVGYVADAAQESGSAVDLDEVVHHVLPCSGDDEWCALSVRSDADRTALYLLLGVSELPSGRDEFAAAISDWTAERDKMDVAQRLQEAGLPAAPMYRAVDVLADPQVRHRKLYADMIHPLFDKPMPTETHPAPYRRIPDADLRPAPMPGEHTREICHKVLGITADETDRLIADGVLFGYTETHRERGVPS